MWRAQQQRHRCPKFFLFFITIVFTVNTKNNRPQSKPCFPATLSNTSGRLAPQESCESIPTPLAILVLSLGLTDLCSEPDSSSTWGNSHFLGDAAIAPCAGGENTARFPGD